MPQLMCVYRGVLPALLEQILQTRVMLKASQKLYSKISTSIQVRLAGFLPDLHRLTASFEPSTIFSEVCRKCHVR